MGNGYSFINHANRVPTYRLTFPVFFAVHSEENVQFRTCACTAAPPFSPKTYARPLSSVAFFTIRPQLALNFVLRRIAQSVCWPHIDT